MDFKRALDGIEHVLRKHGYSDFVSGEEYARLSNEQGDGDQEELEFTWYSLVQAGSWCYLKMEWAEGRDCVEELSRFLNTLLCDAKQVEDTWWLTVYSSGKKTFEHSSDGEVNIGFPQFPRDLDNETKYPRLGQPEPLSEAFGVDVESISPYLYFFTAREFEAFSVLSDGLSSSFTAPLLEGDLRTPGDGWHVADLVRRLGADRIDDVLRGRVEMPPVKYAVRIKKKEPAPRGSSDDEVPPKEYVDKVREGLLSTDPQQRLACANYLFLSDDQEEVPVLRQLAERTDVIGAKALNLLVKRDLPEVLWDLFRQPEGLLPLERAGALRMLARTQDRTLLSAVENCLLSPSLLVRLEALETFARLGGQADHASLLRMVKSSHPFERLTARTVCAFLTGHIDESSLDSDLRGVPHFIDETIPLRYRSLNFRHHQRHLALRVYSLSFLSSVQASSHPAYQALYTMSGSAPYLEDAIKAVRALGLKVVDAPGVTSGLLIYPPISEGGEFPHFLPYVKMFEEAIRSAAGGLAITAQDTQVTLRATQYHAEQ